MIFLDFSDHQGSPKRWGLLQNLDKFDATFFGVPPKQANFMDPQLRFLLEVTHEALIDAGRCIVKVLSQTIAALPESVMFYFCWPEHWRSSHYAFHEFSPKFRAKKLGMINIDISNCGKFLLIF